MAEDEKSSSSFFKKLPSSIEKYIFSFLDSKTLGKNAYSSMAFFNSALAGNKEYAYIIYVNRGKEILETSQLKPKLKNLLRIDSAYFVFGNQWARPENLCQYLGLGDPKIYTKHVTVLFSLCGIQAFAEKLLLNTHLKQLTPMHDDVLTQILTNNGLMLLREKRLTFDHIIALGNNLDGADFLESLLTERGIDLLKNQKITTAEILQALEEDDFETIKERIFGSTDNLSIVI